VPVKPSPIHGADNEAIYGAWLGYTPEEVKTLRAREVI
jgi:hypothetical protein